MEKPGRKIFLAIMAVIGIVALAMQLFLIIADKIGPLIATIICFFSFFTRESNILITLCAIVLLLKPNSVLAGFFGRASTRSALTIYILIAGIVYNMVLKRVWKPAGAQEITHELLHVVLPILFLLYWILYVPKRDLTWNITSWLIFPTIYAAYILIGGAYSGYYPYPFMNAGVLGYPKVIVNIGVLVIAFVGISFLLVAIGKLSVRKKRIDVY